MKLNIKATYAACILAAASLTMTGCTDYLDKSEESDISEEEAFKDFQNFQGFVEIMYNNIPDFSKGYWTNSFNWGEDELLSTNCNYHMGYKIDQGDFWGWQSEHDGWATGWLDRSAFNPTKNDGDDSRFNKGLWPCCWYNIRQCNLGLANLDRLTDATQAQKNAIEGQLLFFRGWCHFMLMQYFGGIPYINKVIDANERIDEPRLAYNECADLVAADLRRAADLLPIDWDKTNISVSTNGKNQLRANKIWALGFLAKNYLYAGSPLMNKTVTGQSSYNKEYCQQAADAFAELLDLVESGQTQYALVDYANIADVFYSFSQGGRLPGSTEAIMRASVAGPWQNTRYGLALQYLPRPYQTDGSVTFSATANYVNYYGMANGLPLSDPDSGFDPTHPWKDRDPRFYNDVLYDGAFVSDNSTYAADLQNAQLYTDGYCRGQLDTYNRTGYAIRKFLHPKCNKADDGWGWSPQFCINVAYLRLADVYLMYAEAVAQATQNPNARAGKCSLTAIDAVNKIRERAGVEGLNSKYTGDLEGFMSELRRERAVELSWEGLRFNDLRRWMLIDKYPYTIKTSQEFTRAGEFDAANPKENAVSGWREEVILTRNFSEKHYWMPLKLSDVNMSPDFPQNPGW
ncbi:MAG: RagB/SusD family nutrient uptake outer membrane protein [Clostridium sp.]|nr:RagB/SusD family nutrient uptake outer membrane protein [Clostridium sp.]